MFARFSENPYAYFICSNQQNFGWEKILFAWANRPWKIENNLARLHEPYFLCVGIFSYWQICLATVGQAEEMSSF